MRTARSLATVLLLGSVIACQPIRTQPAEEPSEEVLPRTTEGPSLATGPLVFPPEPGTRREREALPTRLAVAQPKGEPEVVYPELDEPNEFSFSGQTLRIVFDRAMKHDEKGKVARGALKITPAVAGKARWTGDRYLEFVADEPFDPEQTYSIKLAGLEDDEGHTLESWEAKFTASPQLHIAGKVIGYIPEAGKPRVVATSPLGGDEVGSGYTLAVLYDQKIDLGAARKLIELHDEGGDDVPFKLVRPKKKTFRGIKVDPEFVAVIKPKKRLKTGESYAIVAGDLEEPDNTEESEFTIAEPLRFESVDCGYGYDAHSCEWDDGVLSMDGKEVALVFNNPVGMAAEDIAKHIQITPRVRNMSIWPSYYEGRVFLYGGFEPSKKYKVKVSGLKDIHTSKMTKSASFEIHTAALPASVSMPEGVLVLDENTTKKFGVTTRNVSAAHLMLWPVGDGDDTWAQARGRVEQGKLPDEVAPIQVRITPRKKRDKHVVTTVDLSKYLHAGQDYVATVKLEKTAHGAKEMEFPEWSDAGRPPVALLSPGYGDALALHARATAAGTIVHVARLDDGAPVIGAKLFLEDEELKVKTDAIGFALLDKTDEQMGGKVLRAQAGKTTGRLELGSGTMGVRRLAPELASGTEPTAEGLVGMIVTDRGIYRPGAKVFIKGTVRRRSGDAMVPVPMLPIRVRVLGPGGEEVFSEKTFADGMGSVAVKFDVPKSESLGRHRILLEPTLRPEVELASDIVQIAEFEPPRFTVDVSAEQSAAKELKATVEGRYLFGAAMDGSYADWSLRRSEASFPSGALVDGGFDFRRRRTWWDEEENDEEWLRVGSGALDAQGKLELTQALELDAGAGPQRFTLEAQVSDASYRTIAGRGGVTLHPAERYAGLRIQNSWADVAKPIPVELGVIDTEGHSIKGAKVSAKLERVDWRYTKKRGPGGSVRYEWHRTKKLVQRCQATTKINPVSCNLTPPTSGDYEITAMVDGRPGGVRSLWAWSDDWSEPVRRPDRGHRLELVSDKRRYKPGDKAKLLVTNPFPAATAILTVEQDGIISHQRKRIEGAASMFEVPIEAAHAPHVHATVTLLPIDAKGDQVGQWKFGAARLKVDDGASRLTVEVDSDQDAYEPGEDGKIRIRVLDGGKPAANSEVALSVVDEGVLRLTNFHAADPVKAMRPGRALRLLAADTRDRLAAARERSHVAGDGGGEGSQSITETRKDFVKTLLWEPMLRTDEEGYAEVDMDMPDNLTTFRMMAVALDARGKGGSAEAKFLVRKKVMVVPVVPRFASIGDRFEAAVIVHNNTDAEIEGTVRLLSTEEPIKLAARSSRRVSFDIVTNDPGDLSLVFGIDVDGKTRDQVESVVPVQAPGIDARPNLTGAFQGRQEIVMQVPQSAQADRTGQDYVDVSVGQHLAPGLGSRLEYLLDYPHGCVEQTTSSTLPLIAARDILPRIGMTRVDKVEIDKMIRSGLDRLDSMKTSSGGLAYWPGGHQPNIYGTAYAMRAVTRAELAGVEPPVGLLPGMKSYLQNNLSSTYVEPEVRAAIAQSLAELGELPESSADSLWDTRDEQGVFGLSSLAIALSHLDGQHDRVKELLDEVEDAFDAQGRLSRTPGRDDFYYYGSTQRTKAQAAIALSRLRPESVTLAVLVSDMGEHLPSYTTQGTAYELLALSERMSSVDAEGAQFQLTVDGEVLEPHRDMGHGTKSYRIPLEDLRGKQGLLVMESQSDQAIAFTVGARWRRGLEDAMGLLETTGEEAPDVYRLYTDSKGRPVSLEQIDPGQVLRVALMVRMPTDRVPHERLGYLAITDRLPAGFEAVQPDLWTVARVPDLDESHPFYETLRWSQNDATHVEMHDDRVDMYFDRTWGRFVGATYLVRATTPGSFVAPPPMAEMMYEPDGIGYGAATRVVVR